MPKTSGDYTVKVDGLDAFRKSLKELGPQWPKRLGQAHREAGDLVATAAKHKASVLGGVHRHVMPSIKAAAAAQQAKVSIGGPAWPMAMGAEFGSLAYPQFPPWRGNQFSLDSGNVGYLVQPAARENRDEVMDVFDDAIRRLAAEAFPD